MTVAEQQMVEHIVRLIRKPNITIDETTPLVSSGLIDSMELVDLLLKLEDITPVGGYALGLKWFDGHDSGIYSYAYLRSLCQCAQCKDKG